MTEQTRDHSLAHVLGIGHRPNDGATPVWKRPYILNHVETLRFGMWTNPLRHMVKAGFFNTHNLFADMFKHPSLYLNGMAPLNVAGCEYCCSQA